MCRALQQRPQNFLSRPLLHTCHVHFCAKKKKKRTCWLAESSPSAAVTVVTPNACSHEFIFSMTSSCCSLRGQSCQHTALCFTVSDAYWERLQLPSLEEQMVYRHKITMAMYSQGFATNLVTNPVTEEEQ